MKQLSGGTRPRDAVSRSAVRRFTTHRGRVPLDSHLLGVIEVWDFGFFLADTSSRDDRPPTHFFVKKKFSSTSGAISTTYSLSAEGQGPTLDRVYRLWLPPQGSFFLYEKSVLRESDYLRGRKPEVCTDSTTPFSALKKALEKLRVPRGFNPLGRARDGVSRPCLESRSLPPTGEIRGKGGFIGGGSVVYYKANE